MKKQLYNDEHEFLGPELLSLRADKHETDLYKMADISRAVVDEMNNCRTNPRAYAQKLERLLNYFRGSTIYMPGSSCGLMTEEGPSAVREAIQALNRTPPVETLDWRYGLARAAQDHCNDIGASGSFSHEGSDGSMPENRILRYGQLHSTCGENISYGASTAEDIVVQLLIDDGVPSRGHRDNILNRKFREAGVGFGQHRQMRHVCTIDFAGGYVDSESVEGISSSQSRYSPVAPSSRVREPARREMPGYPSSSRPGKPAEYDDFQEFGDTQMPPGAVSVSTRISTTVRNGRTIKKTVATYTFADGSTQSTEEIEERRE